MVCDLIVIGYEDQFKADEVRTHLLKLQKEFLIDLEDAVVAVKNDKVLTVIQGSGGKVITISLTNQQEQKRQAALDAAKATATG